MAECESLCCYLERNEIRAFALGRLTSMCAAMVLRTTSNPENNKLQPLETNVTSLARSSSSGGEHTQHRQLPQLLYSEGEYGFGEG